MSYIDVMSDAAYGRYSRKLARLAGLPAAVYWSELLDLVGRAVKSKSFDQEGYFQVDRKEISGMTGLTKQAQKEAEAVLAKFDVLAVHPADPDRIGLMCEEMFRLLADTDPKAEKKLAKDSKLSKEEKAQSRRGAIMGTLKQSVKEEDPELLKAYCDWIDVVYDKGIIKPVQVAIFKESIEHYSSDKETKLGVIKTCATRAYKEAAWGIEVYERAKSAGSASRLPEQKIATKDSVNTDISF